MVFVNRKTFVLAWYFLVLISCSDKPEDVNQSPSDFTVSVSEITSSSGKVTWSEAQDPEGATVFYDVFLEDEKVLDNTRNLEFDFMDLDEALQYEGQVVASDPEGNTNAKRFNFTTTNNNSPSSFSIDFQPFNFFFPRIRWSESVDPDGTLVTYKVEVNGTVLVDDLEDLEFLLPELKGLTSYIIKVTASDADGKMAVAEYNFNTPEKVLDNSLLFENQAELNEFSNKGYNRINGDLTIGSNINITDISDLSSLSSLVYLTGDLTIRKTNCQSLVGLENITGNGNFTEIEIVENQELINVEGLNGIVKTYRIYINSNPKLENINGLTNITSVTTEVTISGNESLLNLQGLQKLKDISRIEISYNPALTDLLGLESVNSANEGIYVFSNNMLASVKGLDNLTTVGALYFEENTRLSSVQDLGNLLSVRSLEINNCPLLPNLNGLESLSEVTLALRLTNNEALASLESISNVQFKNGNRDYYFLSLTDLPLITDLNPLENYSISNGNIIFRDNAMLNDFCGINKLANDFIDTIENNFSITGNRYNPSVLDIINGDCASF